jgi:hypothetical protein
MLTDLSLPTLHKFGILCASPSQVFLSKDIIEQEEHKICSVSDALMSEADGK